MKYFKRKVTMFILFLFCGVIVLLSGLLQLKMNNQSSGIFQIFVALLFAFDAYVYKRPYLALGEGKLNINNGFSKTEILLKDITSIDKKNKKLIITFNRGSSTMKLNILLSHLKNHDQEQLIKDLKLELEAKFV
ncbi:MAG: PH domain-containing protein [Desulfosporosinus sp.]|nr:PH domain-containing protein [Desulfosporosinus sp.]